MSVIAKRQFTMTDLQWFASISGDWNPIHVDAVAARRLLAGEVVVHGMFTLLWALDEFCGASGVAPVKINVRFHRPILLSQELTLTQDEDSESGEIILSVYWAEEEVTTIWITLGKVDLTSVSFSDSPPKSSPLDRSFEDLKGDSGEATVAGRETDLNQAFSHLPSSIGLLPVASLLTFSRIIGMQCPGLHSLFTGLKIQIRPEEISPKIFWEVSRHTVPYAPIRILVKGGGLAGSIDAFVRPRPAKQLPMEVVASAVKPSDFSGQLSWVVGGSRGLGELTAKIIAAGGGEVIISYMAGKADAERVRDQIINWGGHCQIVQMDVEHPDAAIDDLLSMPTSISHLYYFASPRIRQSKSGLFDLSLYEKFNQIYVMAFSKIMKSLSMRLERGWCVFYPSTVFLDERPKGFGEYITAKAAGEELCQYLSQHIKDTSIIVRRLPMLPTDQTQSLIRKEKSDPLSELLSVVSELHHSFREKNLS